MLNKKNSLAFLFPRLRKEWHPSRNLPLLPEDITPGSGKRVWWQCEKGHEWQARVCDRKNGSNCPFCSKNRKLTIEEMRKIAISRNGKCLSNTYINNSTKLLWECEFGHTWEAKPGDIKNSKTWCPVCAGKEKLSIEEMQRIAKERGGECLSLNYKNIDTKLQWKCSRGHVWQSTPYRIMKDSWCPTCAGNKKLTIKDMKELAVKRGGRCLSATYKDNKTKLLWECEYGHKWEASPKEIKNNNTWCPTCAGKEKLTIEEMRYIAKERGGECLSENYSNLKSKLRWKCSEGHIWEATPLNIKHQNSWCPYCAKRAPLTLSDMQIIAKERGGKCLSKDYVNSHSKLLWQCKYGHQWEALAYTVRQGRWCPECSTGLGERICREAFRQIFKKNFPKSYPPWLVSENNKHMELDGYCKSLGLAFEHHGRQHYTTRSIFIQTIEELKLRKKADSLKRELCEKNGVILIEIPEIPSIISLQDVKSTIVSLCKQKNVNLPNNVDRIQIDYKKAYQTNYAKDELKRLKLIASKRGGKCLSSNYVNNTTKLIWECSEKHQWSATPDSIKQGTWCPICAGRPRLFIEDMHKLASKKGGKCLSEFYVNTNTKILWECSNGHKWYATPDSIKHGSWCPTCTGKKRLTIEKMHQIAAERKGKCLSNSYKNTKTKLVWQCQFGHIWEATPPNVISGSWCPICYFNSRKNRSQTKG